MVLSQALIGEQILAGRQRLGAAAALLPLTRSSGATLGTARQAFGTRPRVSGAARKSKSTPLSACVTVVRNSLR
jgi:hypothetical protein